MNNNTIRINFNLDKHKHAKLKARAFLEHTNITSVLTKAVDAFIGKGEINNNSIKPHKVALHEVALHKQKTPQSAEKFKTYFK